MTSNSRITKQFNTTHVLRIPEVKYKMNAHNSTRTHAQVRSMGVRTTAMAAKFKWGTFLEEYSSWKIICMNFCWKALCILFFASFTSLNRLHNRCHSLSHKHTLCSLLHALYVPLSLPLHPPYPLTLTHTLTLSPPHSHCHTIFPTQDPSQLDDSTCGSMMEKKEF